MRILTAVIGACALALALTAQAEAKVLTFPSVEVKKSKGYSGFVSANDGKVTLSVSNKDSNASYSAKGTGTSKVIKAKFKGFGKINLKFQPKGKPVKTPPPDGCKGPTSTFQEGVWVGKLTFKGENGYVKFDEKTLQGGVVTRPDKELDCDVDLPDPGNPKPCVFVSAEIGGVNVTGRAIEGKPPEYSAFLNDERNGVTISKNVSVKGGGLTVNADAQTATVSPPSPFKGDGTVADGSLSGSLSVELPGETVSLAGAGWTVSDGTCS